MIIYIILCIYIYIYPQSLGLDRFGVRGLLVRIAQEVLPMATQVCQWWFLEKFSLENFRPQPTGSGHKMGSYRNKKLLSRGSWHRYERSILTSSWWPKKDFMDNAETRRFDVSTYRLFGRSLGPWAPGVPQTSEGTDAPLPNASALRFSPTQNAHIASKRPCAHKDRWWNQLNCSLVTSPCLSRGVLSRTDETPSDMIVSFWNY